MSISLINNNYQNAYNYNQAVTGNNVDSSTSKASAQTGTDVAKTSQIQAPKECQTCKNRKYQDQSDDHSVSFQTPQSIPTALAFSEVAAHENEHVRNEQARAKQNGLKIVYQSVSIHTDVCPECGRMYISGGTTHTVTAPDDKKDPINGEKNKNSVDVTPGLLFDKRA